jgi:hypothetical protein
MARLAGHSLRVGYTTTTAAQGVEERNIARVTRHRNLTVLRGYMRPRDGVRRLGAGAVGVCAAKRPKSQRSAR